MIGIDGRKPIFGVMGGALGLLRADQQTDLTDLKELTSIVASNDWVRISRKEGQAFTA